VSAPEPAQRTRRVFFALWPGRRLAADLAAIARERGVRGRAIPGENLHLTLAFIGPVTDKRLRELQGIAGSVRAPAFDLLLDRIEHRPRQRMLWACADEIPPALAELVRDLNAGLAAAGFRVEERPFSAHVTLVRDCRCEAAPVLPAALAWQVIAFVLAASRLGAEGARYTVASRWKFAGGSPVTGR